MNDARFERLQSLAGSVSRETFEALLSYEALFRRWNERINLASRHTMGEFWDRHVIDSAQILKLAPNARNWLDIGSGGGLPGAVLAILLRDHPGCHLSMVESNGKKASFLRTVMRETGAPATVHCERIEQHMATNEPDVITARALAPLKQLVVLTSRWLERGAVGLFHKGRDYQAEIQETDDLRAYHLIKHESVVDSDSVILEISRRKSATMV